MVSARSRGLATGAPGHGRGVLGGGAPSSAEAGEVFGAGGVRSLVFPRASFHHKLLGLGLGVVIAKEVVGFFTVVGRGFADILQLEHREIVLEVSQ